MLPLVLTFDIPTKILQGLIDGSLVRNGGVIQDTSGRIVMWLREIGASGAISGAGSNMISSINPVTGAANLVMQGVNAGISLKGFAAVTQQLNQIQGLLSITTATSMLSLGVSVIGFTIIAKRLKELEKRLEKLKNIWKN